jgi:hypothetical protein
MNMSATRLKRILGQACRGYGLRAFTVAGAKMVPDRPNARSSGAFGVAPKHARRTDWHTSPQRETIDGRRMSTAAIVRPRTDLARVGRRRARGWRSGSPQGLAQVVRLQPSERRRLSASLWIAFVEQLLEFFAEPEQPLPRIGEDVERTLAEALASAGYRYKEERVIMVLRGNAVHPS